MKPKITPTGTDMLKEQGPTSPIPRFETVTSSWTMPDSPLSLSPPELIPVPESQPLKIALIGTAPSSRMLAPYNDPTWKIWVCSPGNMGVLPRVDAWFELHSNLLYPECISYGGPYIEWLKKQTFPIYMQDQSLVPNAIPYPKDEMVQEFGRYFFTSSFSWMIAFAIKQGVKELGLFGIDMASKDEYIHQRSGGHYFMQEAHRRGIQVMLPTESDLMQPPPLYGYSDNTPFHRKLHVRAQELKDRIGGMRIERDKLIHNITYLEGALEDIDYMQSIWGGAQG